MEKYFRQAIANVTIHGDTDIFPFPIENHIFHDSVEDTVKLLEQLHGDFQKWLAGNPPSNEGALAPVSYTGFRWANQLDPLWNLYFLALVLSIAEEIEAQRISTNDLRVFSYRYAWNEKNATIFDTNYNWRSFMECSLRKAGKHAFIVICDISEFYPRLGHHRLENALAHLNLKSDIPSRIEKFLSNFSNKNSFGIPIGGPAARILSELVLNQIDQLLKLEAIEFCRFSDDFHLFAESMEDGFAKLLTLTEKLQNTQGLQLQKSKTRIMSSAEFISTSPLKLDDHDAPENPDNKEKEAGLAERSRSLMQFSLKFDPYSATAEEDYEELKREIEKFDIIGLLHSELSKSRIHIALARKIVSTIKYLDPKQRDQAVLSLMNNVDLLYPIFSSILLVVRQVFGDLSGATQTAVIDQLQTMLKDGSHVLRVELVLAYAVRVLAQLPSASVQETLVRVYGGPQRSAFVRRDIILAMTRLGAWPWLSDRRNSFGAMSPPERRAFIIASYSLKDEGKHWRQHINDQFSPMEQLVREWASKKSQMENWVVPL
jgi:Reverse transcriptase (RNA-dependent DNA polymerase)